ncbi:hypothetical protein [Streptomyces sp. B6B3]|uniref:hypothetical protein n=1 Tax=Streptomyces sp. B6B3 TaxID=3153570 RepID=UPI00325ED893
MHPLLGTLASRLVERWLSLLVLPGALFLGVTVAGAALGHAHWYDAERLGAELDEFAERPAADQPGTVVLLVAAVLLLACAASLAGQFLGGAIERFWLRTARDPVSRALVKRRRRRWERQAAAREAARARSEAAARPDESGDDLVIPADAWAEVVARTAARDRIALRRPVRPTWYGDRMESAAERVHDAYGIDLAAVWPRLWLVLAEPGQRQIQSARESFSVAARLAAWAVLYAVLALWWWPSALIAAGCAVVARARARDALDALASLTEAAVDVHARELATQIGLLTADPPEPLGHAAGTTMSELFRKDTD